MSLKSEMKAANPMMNIFYILFYNLFVFPLLFSTFHVLAFFNLKYRKGISGRYQTYKKAADFSRLHASEEVFLFHCASMGEFEHTKPLIRSLKQHIPDCKIVVMFFSPSGYEHIKPSSEIDLVLYAPFDNWLSVYRLFKQLNPAALLIARYDVWPNQLWVAQYLEIPCFLINATIHHASKRLSPWIWHFQKSVYAPFQKIFAISNLDKQRYRQLCHTDRVIRTGDTKFDQVIFRCQESQQQTFIDKKIISEQSVLVCGSIWPEDETHLIPALKTIQQKYPHLNLLSILCPHEPTSEHIQQLQQQILPSKSCLYSQLKDYSNEPVIIIDRIGLLANLYSLAQIAYVGGGFKQNVHNVLEPAVYGIPVIFGPVNQNSHEAQLLKKIQGGISVDSESTLTATLENLLTDPLYAEETGHAASALVKKHQGATVYISEIILESLKQPVHFPLSSPFVT